MKISKNGISFIKKFEGCKLVAYKPVATEKYYTIGIGHYGSDVTRGMVITEARAEELFRNDITPIETLLNGMGINFTQSQFDSLCSFIFNLGVGNFNVSTLKIKIVANAPDEDITDQIVKWVNAGGKPLLGLKKRRVEEANLWLGFVRYYVNTNGVICKK